MDIYNSDMCRAWHARNPNWNIFEMSPFRMLKWHWQSLYLQSKCNCQVSVLPCFNACYYLLHIAPHCTVHIHTHTLAVQSNFCTSNDYMMMILSRTLKTAATLFVRWCGCRWKIPYLSICFESRGHFKRCTFWHPLHIQTNCECIKRHRAHN